MITSEILNHYNDGKEEHRLTLSLGRLERIRTWEIMERYLPPAPARVLDVGGGTGVYALPLCARGYRVDLIDAVRFENLIAVEGPGWVNEDLDAWLDNTAARERLLQVLRRIETEPTLIGASAHLIAVARK